ncbi:MAG: hypothetical protein ACK5QX_03850, partial [bacterium]
PGGGAGQEMTGVGKERSPEPGFLQGRYDDLQVVQCRPIVGEGDGHHKSIVRALGVVMPSELYREKPQSLWRLNCKV